MMTEIFRERERVWGKFAGDKTMGPRGYGRRIWEETEWQVYGAHGESSGGWPEAPGLLVTEAGVRHNGKMGPSVGSQCKVMVDALPCSLHHKQVFFLEAWDEVGSELQERHCSWNRRLGCPLSGALLHCGTGAQGTWM
jgi:hypothetical protein